MPIRLWFEELQRDIPEAHISCAGRNMVEQDTLYFRRATKARWKQSAHNYNAAIDIFKNETGNLYPLDWFTNTIKPRIPEWLNWYGSPGSKYYELPHFEAHDWERLRDAGFLKLIKE